MIKLLLLVAVCVFGTVLCETHEQQKEYAEDLIYRIDDTADEIKELLINADVTTEKGKNVLLMQASLLNYDIHFIIDCLQNAVYNNQEQPEALQEIALKLNDIIYELEKSLQHDARVIKLHLQRSVKNIVREAENLEKIVQDNNNHMYRTIVLRLLDDLVTAIDKLFFRAVIRAAPVKIVLKSYIYIARMGTVFTLSLIDPTNTRMESDIVRYNAKFSSAISTTANFLKDIIITYGVDNEDQAKEIVYLLGKISQANEEVLYDESSFRKIIEQFQITVVDVAEQLNKLVDAGFSKNGLVVQDEKLIYMVFPEMYSQSYKLMRNLEKTLYNYDDYSSKHKN